MRVLRRFIHREALLAVGFVTLGFLALFFFFDLIDELRWVGRTGSDGYQLSHALLFVSLSIPNHLYELLPITVLIGTIFVMARLAQSSEFTIMRTSGLGPWQALRTLLTLGGFFVLLTFAVGDYITPLSERAAQLIKVRHLGRLTSGATGAWLKERQQDHSFAVNVRALTPDGGMLGVRIFEFDEKGQLTFTDPCGVGAIRFPWDVGATPSKAQQLSSTRQRGSPGRTAANSRTAMADPHQCRHGGGLTAQA